MTYDSQPPYGEFTCLQIETGSSFSEETSRLKFLALLYNAKTAFSFRLHAYSLVPSRALLLIETDSASPAAVLKWLHTSYQQYLEDTHQTKLLPPETCIKEQFAYEPRLFIETCKFIHLSPCFEGLCPLPSEWNWSSYNSYLYHKPVSLLDRELLYTLFPSETQAAFRSFHERELETGTSPEHLKEIYTAYLASLHALRNSRALPGFTGERSTFLLPRQKNFL